MVQTRSGKNVKHPPQGLQPKPLSKKQAKRLLKQQQSTAANGAQVLKAHKEVKLLRRARAYRLQREILGGNRTFPGSIVIPNPQLARAKDDQRLGDIHAAISKGTAIVYWADGSHSSSGYLGAGVAWRGPENFWYQTYHLGRHTGEASDAEVFAIAAALGRAKKAVEAKDQIQLVRVYTDAKVVLEGLSNGNQHQFGPMINPRTALQGVYERAEWLLAKGIKLELIWVKGHSQSEGNNWADQAATQAVTEQLKQDQQGNEKAGVRQNLMTEEDIPSIFNEKGPDWAEEWLARANAHIVRRNNLQQAIATVIQDTNATLVQEARATMVEGASATTVQQRNAIIANAWNEAEAVDGSRDRPIVID